MRMTLRDFTDRVAQSIKRVTHYSLTVNLSERRIKRLHRHYVLDTDPRDAAARAKLKKKIIYWRARKLKAEDFRANWRVLLKRRRQQKIAYAKNHPPVDGDGFARWVNPDGTVLPVAPWMVGLAPGPEGLTHNWLDHAKRLGWDGWLNSGVRTAAHSIELCYQICGAPSCSGLCAGASSNHNCTGGCPAPQGAIDVRDFSKFGAIMQTLGAPLRNDLPIDPVHYSYTGH